MQSKSKRLAQFYVSELLNHVKSMSEPRFSPIAYHIIKRVIQHVVSGDDPVQQLERLARVERLKPFGSFLLKQIQPIGTPSFRMSELMSAMESDSEKISGIFRQILSEPGDQRQLEKDLTPLGLILELDHVQALKEKSAPTVMAPTPKAVPGTDEAFSNVGDMIGFLARRGTKPAAEDTEAAVTSERSASSPPPPAVSADERASFLTELREHFRGMDSLLRRLGEQPASPAVVTGIGDAIGEVRRTFKMYGYPEMYQVATRLEKRINDVSDNIHEENLTLSAQSGEVLADMRERILSFDFARYFDQPSALTLPMEGLLLQFEQSLVPRSSASGTPVKTLVSDEEKRQWVGTPAEDGSEHRLDLSGISPTDLQLFKDEVYSYFDSIDAALLDLKKDGANTGAIRVLQLSFKGVHTASRMLHLTLFRDLCGHALTVLGDIVRRRSALTVEAQKALLTLRSSLRLLVEGQPVFSRAIEEIRSGLTWTEPASATVPEVSRAEPRAEAASWVDDIQGIISEFKDVRATPEPVVESPVPEIAPAVGAGEPEAEPVETAAPAVVAPAVKKAKPVPVKVEDVETGATEPVDLLNLMASDNVQVDLGDVKLESFIDKISREPQDIVAAGSRRTSRKPSESQKVTMMPQTVVVPAEPAIRADGFYLQETHFSNVDAEILDIFVQESEGYFVILDRALERLSANPKDDTGIKDLERTSHSLKSSARMLGFERISGLASAIELISERYFEKEIECDADLVELFGDIVKALHGLFQKARVEIRSVLVRLLAWEKRLSAPDIFTKNIPGAQDIEKLIVPDTVPEGPREIPARAEVKAAEKPETKPDYFAATGVDPEIVEIFKEETRVYFKLIGSALETLRRQPASESALKDVEKAAHSLGSSAKMLGFQKINALVRPLEIIAERSYKSGMAVEPALVDLLSRVLTTLQSLEGGADVETNMLVAALEDAERMVSKTDVREGADRAQILQAIKRQLEEAPTGEVHPAAVEQDTKPAKQVRSPKTVEIPDFQIKNEPIFRRLYAEDTELLSEMAQSSEKQP